MQFYTLETIDNDPRYCFISPKIPCDLAGGYSARPAMDRLGLQLLDLAMDEDEGGLELGDYVSNIRMILALRRSVAQAFVDGFDVGEHELIPARLINEKQRVHSDDYLILNLLGPLDILDRDRSDVFGDEDCVILNPFLPWSILAKLIPPGRDLFRVAGLTRYVFSQRLVDFVVASKFSNFGFTPVELS